MPGGGLLSSSWVAEATLRTLPRNCSVILSFHRVGGELPPWHNGISPAALERVVTAFARVLTPVPVRELGRPERTGRSLAITFDDGFADNAEVAAPLLSRLGIPAAFFLPAGCIESGLAPWPDLAYAQLSGLAPERLARLAARLAPGRPAGTALEAAHAVVHGLKLLDPSRRELVLAALPLSERAGEWDAGRPMTWGEARELIGRGFEIGSHGHSHSILTTLGDEQLAYELEASRHLLESRLGGDCDAIAYPDDRFDDRVLGAAAAAGYRLGFGGGAGPNVPPLVPLALQRVSGEDARIGTVALRLRRRPQVDAAGHYGKGRATEYGFITQARQVRAAFSGLQPGRVLDAGCGVASLMPALQEAGVREVVGVDHDPGMVAAARRERPEGRFLRADIANLPFPDGSFDAAVSLGVLEYVPDAAVVLRELARVVRPGGTVLLSAPQRNTPNDLGFRLAEALGFGHRERSAPLTETELRLAAGSAGLRPVAVRATNFFAFPLDALAPGPSRRLAEALDRRGNLPLVRRLGAQLFLEAVAEPPTALEWLVPTLPTGTTFLDRELAQLRRLELPVRPVAPRLGLGALRTLARRPLASLVIAARLQLLKAPLDRERGRLGYVVLALRGMTLAHELAGSRSRVHATFADGVGTVAYVAASLARVPFTFTAHSPYSLWQGSRLLRRQAEAAECVFCVSDDMERRLAELAPGSRLIVVRCLGPAAAPTRRLPESPFVLLAVGAPLPLKGFTTAIEAVALAVTAGADVRLELIGDGPGTVKLRTRVGQLGLGDRVSFAGQLDNSLVLDRLASALALLAPSEVQADGDRDGLPVSILDAASCEVPAIATAVSGIREFVVDGESGLIVPERDPDALASAILRLCRDPELASRLGRAARVRLESLHDPEREVAKLTAVWFRGLRGDGSQPAGDRSD